MEGKLKECCGEKDEIYRCGKEVTGQVRSRRGSTGVEVRKSKIYH